MEKEIVIRKVADDGAGYEFITVMPWDLDPQMDFKYVPGSSLPESRASRMDQAMDLIQLGLLDPEKFWRWTQKDISQDILDELLEQKQEQIDMMRRDAETLQNSEDEEELTNAQLRLREMMGYGGQPEPEQPA